MTPTVSFRPLASAFAALTLLAAGTASVFADTSMGLIGDTDCANLLSEFSDPSGPCDQAVDRRVPWLLTAVVVAVVLAAAAIVVRSRRAPSAGPRGAVLVTAIALVVASLALGWWGAYRLGDGRDSYCGSPITGAGTAPYDQTRPQQCAEEYHHERLLGLLALGGGAALIVVPAGAYAAARRR